MVNQKNLILTLDSCWINVCGAGWQQRVTCASLPKARSFGFSSLSARFYLSVFQALTPARTRPNAAASTAPPSFLRSLGRFPSPGCQRETKRAPHEVSSHLSPSSLPKPITKGGEEEPTTFAPSVFVSLFASLKPFVVASLRQRCVFFFPPLLLLWFSGQHGLRAVLRVSIVAGDVRKTRFCLKIAVKKRVFFWVFFSLSTFLLFATKNRKAV